MTIDPLPSASRFPPATLVIPTRDRPSLVVALLRSVLDGDLLPDEILVVDQSAQCDGAVEAIAAEAPTDIRHVHQHAPGTSLARNVGARRATHDVVLFLDDDVTVDPSWCRTIRSCLIAMPAPSVVTGRVRAAVSTAGTFAPSTIDATERAIHVEPGDVDVLYAANVALDRRILEGLGGFDVRLGPGTRFPAAEDNDLAHRLLVAGIPVVFEPTAIVTHEAWRPASARRALRWRYGRGQGAFLAKHLGEDPGGTGPRLRSESRRYLRRAVRRMVRDRAGSLDDFAYLSGLISGAAEWLVRATARRRGRR